MSDLARQRAALERLSAANAAVIEARLCGDGEALTRHRAEADAASAELKRLQGDRPSGPRCGHSVCSQRFIDTGDARCTR